MAKGFVYRGSDRSVETVVRKSKQAGGLYDSYLISTVQTYKPKEGECNVRILPPTWDDMEKWGDGWDIGIFLHYGIGADDAAYLCLDKMKGEDCPICEARSATTDADEQKELKPSYRALCWVIDRDNEKAGPLIWSMPNTLFMEINARSVDKKTNAPILIDSDEEGYDVVFNRSGTGLKTKYTGVEVSRDPTPIHDNQKTQQKWLAYISENPLPDCLNFYEEDYIKKVLFGKSDKSTKDVDEDADEKPQRRSARKPVEEDEDDVKPARSSRRPAAVGVEEEEEEEPPFEPDEKPARRAAKKPEPEEENEDEGEDEPSSTVTSARRSLERLKAGKR